MHIIVNPFFYFFPLCLRKWVSPAFYLRRRAKKRGAGIFLMAAPAAASLRLPSPAAAGKHRVANLEDIAYTGFVHEKQNDNVIKGGKTSGRNWAKYRPIYEVSHRARSLRAACLLFIKGKGAQQVCVAARLGRNC